MIGTMAQCSQMLILEAVMLYLIHPEALKEMYKAQGYSILSITGCDIYIYISARTPSVLPIPVASSVTS